MRFILNPIGSGGDVRPFISIGRALAARGNDVVLLAAEPFERSAREAGLRFISIWPTEDYERETLNPDLWDPMKGPKLVMRILTGQLETLWDAVASVSLPDETIIVAHTLAFAARAFGEKNAIRTASVHVAPNIFRSEYGQSILPDGRDLNRLPRFLVRPLWRALDRFLIDPMLAPELNQWRAEKGLPPLKRVFDKTIHDADLVLALFPEWFGPPQPDWPPAKLAGFPIERTIEPVDPVLESWLEEGDAPVVVTPGTANRQAEEFLGVATEAATRLGRRVLLATPWADKSPEVDGRVRTFAYAPFTSMLHRCAAIVHHGGIGTCAQGLRSGVPQLVMPMGFDQPDNAARLRTLGVGASIRPNRFKIDAVARELDRLLTDGSVAAACEKWRHQSEQEDGVGAACDVLERLAATPRP